MAQPLLDNLELQQVQEIETEQDQLLVQHSIPALEGDFLQRLDRRATQVTLTGVLTGAEVGESLKTLREKFRAAQPVSFVGDITAATKVDQVLIEEMRVRELAGKPVRFEYAFTLREYIPPAENLQEQSEAVNTEVDEEGRQEANQTVEDITENVGGLEVKVTLANNLQDFTGIVVLVEGEKESGERITFLMEAQAEGVYRRENVAAGRYTFRAFRRP